VKISSLLGSYIDKYGFKAIEVHDFNQVMRSFLETQVHLVLIDIHLPKFDGFYWCRQIRAHSHCPILFISARDSQMDQVMALENGADDYITKPFDYEVVIAKIRSHLRRAYGSYSGGVMERKLEVGNLVLYPERFIIMQGDQTSDLTQKEAILLEALMVKANRVVTRGRLLDLMWEDHHFIDDNTLNVYIARLRQKLKELNTIATVETVRGVGYLINATIGDTV